MRNSWILALIVVSALLTFGCFGAEKPSTVPNSSVNTPPATAGMDQFLKNDTQTDRPSTMPALNNSGPETVPEPGLQRGPEASGADNFNNSTPLISGQNAFMISMLRKGENLSFGRLQLRLDNIIIRSGPLAQYALLDLDGKEVQKIELGQNQSVQFTGPDKVVYAIRTIFRVGEGMPNAVQTQIYKSSSSPSGAIIGRPENAYTLTLQYPAPLLMVSRNITVGEMTAAVNGIGAELVSIDRTTQPAGATLRILDGSGAEIGTTQLQSGQMAQVSVDAKNRFEVALGQIDSQRAQAAVSIYRVLAFANASYIINNNGG